MSLNIKNEETCRLAAELARLTGETMTNALTVALREPPGAGERLRNAEALAGFRRAWQAKDCAGIMEVARQDSGAAGPQHLVAWLPAAAASVRAPRVLDMLCDAWHS